VSGCAGLTYGEFGARLSGTVGGERVPLAGSFELTFRCNLRCVHCYIPDFSGRGELPGAEVTRILSEAADEGCLWMLLTGGEVLLRRDFAEIYRHAKRLGLLVTVFSNGTLFDERVADLMAEYPPFALEFTLYGLSDETYLRTTGFAGRFEKVRRAVELAIDRRLRLTLKAVAMEPLRDEIPRMQAWAASLGVPFRYDGMIHGRLDGSLKPAEARSTPKDLFGWDERDEKRMNDWMTFYLRFVKTATPTGALLSCGAGLQSFHVDPRGTLLSCEALPLDGYDLRRGSFREGWRGTVAEVRRRRASPANVCAGCELRSLCDRCPATATMETGSPDGWIPHYCEVTHRRAALLEERLGDHDRAARYRAHAEKVATGWVPPGAITPRAQALAARPAGGDKAAACATGGCAAGGCGSVRPAGVAPLDISLPSRPTRAVEHPDVAEEVIA
jgi:radical SAM protein with 4Fe4S-binding SPASM domain